MQHYLTPCHNVHIINVLFNFVNDKLRRATILFILLFCFYVLDFVDFESLSQQHKEIKNSVADATRPPIYGELKTVTKFVTTVGHLSENVLAKLDFEHLVSIYEHLNKMLRLS